MTESLTPEALDLIARSSVLQREWGFQDCLVGMIQANGAVAAAAAPYLRSHPRHAALAAQREHVIVDRCAAPGCRDRCSRCVRARAVEKNRRLHGQDDYPGVCTMLTPLAVAS